ncbi:hypothetical protein MTR67_011001 [Solanum verrucosum]|uniref:Uncharacterized protein n=1 Tax=Solanum verrucosum TaxID=315347 RepID=A0AAF0TFR6_SOLVR|nr:hypothetical protein MTR67_011001 [Solanum verrucosum]
MDSLSYLLRLEMTRRLIAVQHQHKRLGMTMHMDNLTLISKKPGYIYIYPLNY